MTSTELAACRSVAPRQADTDPEVIRLWLHGKSANTQRIYTASVQRFADFVDGPLIGVTLGDLQAFADSLEESGLAPATRALTLASIKSLLTFANRIGYLMFNVGAAVQLPAVPDRLAERIIDVKTMRRVIEREPSARNRLLLRMLYASGCRVSELCGLRWREVQPRDDDKGQATFVLSKNGKTRAVLLPSALYADLEEQRGGPDELVFPLSTSGVWHICKAAGRRAGVEHLSPHWFRHAHASHSIDGGAAITLVRDTLGHSSLATTSRYAHARPGNSSAFYLPQV